MKKLYVTHTFGTSIRTWVDVGIVLREMRIYQAYLEHGWHVTMFSYGDATDASFLPLYYRDHPNFHLKTFSPVPFPFPSVVNRRLNLVLSAIRIFYSLCFVPKHSAVLKTSQLSGSWLVGLASLLTSNPWICRTGYDHFSFTRKLAYGQLWPPIRHLAIQTDVFIHRIFLNCAHSVIVSSKSDAQTMSKYFHGPISVNPNWVYTPNVNPLDQASDVCKRLTADPILRLVTVSRLEPQKQILPILRALSYFTPGHQCIELDIYGNGSDRARVISMLQTLQFPASLKENLPNEELFEKLSEYHLFILNSSIEGTPKSLLEAMSAGLLILARNSPGISSIIKSYHNGILYDDESEIIQKIQQIRSMDTGLLCDMLINSITYAHRRHSFGAFALNELSIAHSALSLV